MSRLRTKSDITRGRYSSRRSRARSAATRGAAAPLVGTVAGHVVGAEGAGAGEEFVHTDREDWPVIRGWVPSRPRTVSVSGASHA